SPSSFLLSPREHPMRPVPCAMALAVSLCSSALAQALTSGTYVATTTEVPIVATSSSVQVIDPFAATTTALSITGFPPTPAPEGPDGIYVETIVSMLLGTRIVGATGNLYRATVAGTGWNATMLNTGPMLTESVGAIVELPSGIYVAGSVAG